MLRKAKLAILDALRASGGMRLVSGLDWRRRKLLILSYHGISTSDEHLWSPDLFISPALFEKRLRTLNEGGFHVLPLGEAALALQRNALPPKSVVLTFDDGFANFYREAWPLLQAYEMPATVYLTTYYCYYNRPVFMLVVRYLLWLGRDRKNSITDPALGWNTPQNIGTPEGAEIAVQLLLNFADTQEISAAGKDELAEILAGHLGLNYDEIRNAGQLNLMTPEQVAEIHKGGISVQLHTHRHRTPRDTALFAGEIRENRERLQAITGEVPRHFCYPAGVWRPDMFPVLHANSIQTATTCDPGLALPKTAPLLLPRHIDTTPQTAAEFEGWISGVSQFLPRRSAPPSIMANQNSR